MQKALFWGALVTMIGTTAYLDARGITALVSAALSVDAPALARAPMLYAVNEPSRNAERAMVSNPFDSTAKPPPRIIEPEGPIDPRDAAACEGLTVRVIAFAEEPAYSLASLWDTRNSQSFVGRRGDAVDGQSVAYIGRDRVWLARGDTLCQVAMYAPTALVANVQNAHIDAKPVVAKPADPALLRGIEKRGERDFAVDRGVLARVLDDPSELMKLGQTLPVMINGKMVGVQLKGIRPGSLLFAVGLSDGDTLEKVNGYELTSAEKIFEAYAHLREMPHLTMQVTRGGKPMTFDYTIR